MKLSEFSKLIKECKKYAQICDPEISFSYGKTKLEIMIIDQFQIIPDTIITFKKEKK